MIPSQHVKSFSVLLSRAARATTVEDMRGETVALELRRQLHCCAYNALVALISCTQTELKFYVAFLFSENPLKVSTFPQLDLYVHVFLKVSLVIVILNLIVHV